MAAVVGVLAVLAGVVVAVGWRGEPGGVRVDGRWFARADGTPLFWLADTSWDLVAADPSAAEDYLARRADQGYTVVRTALLRPGSPRDAAGHPAYRGHLGALDTSPGGYWDHVDDLVAAATAQGLTMALAPVWSDGQAGSLVTADNAREYGAFLGARYEDASVLWLTGGDDDGSHGEVWSELVAGLREGGSDAPVSHLASSGSSDAGPHPAAGSDGHAEQGSDRGARSDAPPGSDRASGSVETSGPGAAGPGSNMSDSGRTPTGESVGSRTDGPRPESTDPESTDPESRGSGSAGMGRRSTSDAARGEGGSGSTSAGSDASGSGAGTGSARTGEVRSDVTGTAAGTCASSASRADARAAGRESGDPLVDATPPSVGEDCGSAGTTTPHDARAEAWRATLGGATGATYAGSEADAEAGSDAGGEAEEGAAQLGVLRRVMESRPYRLLEPADEALGGSGLEGSARVSAAVASDGSFLVAYTPEGMDVTVDLDMLAANSVRASWVDPRTGEVLEVPEPVEATGTAAFEAPAGTGDERDWVLVLDDDAAGYGAPGTEVLEDPAESGAAAVTPAPSVERAPADPGRSSPTPADSPSAGSESGGARPARSDPARRPAEPRPREPQPTEPQPTEPQPGEPQPEEPQPREPRPTESQPTIPEPPAAEPATDSTWDRLATCESSGNWAINTGNGYYGGLQFSSATWSDFGGTAHAPRADQATKEQQIEIATKVRDRRGGYGSWPACARKLGLPR
ncbi:hypothetical protein GCM10023175_59290 [Pseudonocardia xishanensis]|uniref:Collagenase-like protein with collagen-binding domain n=1 Tax=Pseudonocardia xishanensis TaxID=630995 RepID=A0ABP8S0E6_9PSEU